LSDLAKFGCNGRVATVLASCDALWFTSRLSLVPIDGGPATALTAVNDGQKGPDLRDASAWQLPAGTFVQAKLNVVGTTSPVSVPDVAAGRSVIVDGALRRPAIAKDALSWRA
jgi:TolB protein